jgi:hypothetical protein
MMTMSRRLHFGFLSAAAIATLAFLWSAGEGRAQSKEPVVIGVGGPLTGQ